MHQTHEQLITEQIISYIHHPHLKDTIIHI